jgi:hypothetical protein
MTEQADAAYLIRAKVTLGQLPRSDSQKTWAGFGSGRSCDGGERPIRPTEVEHGVEVVAVGTLWFHKDCLFFWHQASARDISGGCSPSVWTLFFDQRIARAANRDRVAYNDLRAASAEALIAAAQTQARSAVVRARTRNLLAQSRRLCDEQLIPAT